MKSEFHIDGFIGSIEKLHSKLRFGFKNVECYLEDDGSILVRYDEEDEVVLERERELLLTKKKKLEEYAKKEKSIPEKLKIYEDISKVRERIHIIERSVVPCREKSYDKEL